MTATKSGVEVELRGRGAKRTTPLPSHGTVIEVGTGPHRSPMPGERVELLAVLPSPDGREVEVHLAYGGQRTIGRGDIGGGPAAAANADWAHAKGYYLILTNQPADDAWPITGASFIIVYKQPANPPELQTALKFFDWAYKNGAKLAADLDYVPMPDQVIADVEKTWAAEIKGTDGKSIF